MNRLKDSASAYLVQHAQDPVHWQPWGAEAFKQAQAENKPVFISIGYAACHWCHVMARESFRDFEVAAQLNENFVSIKVDREEHPQVDERYMSATQLMTGQGGWPMSVFALPDGQVFYAGTYFPPESRQGIPSFSQLLDSIVKVWTTNRDQLEASAHKITQALKEEAKLNQRILTAELPGPDINELFGENLGWQQLSNIVQSLAKTEDTKNGGFGGAQGPKFPPSPTIGFLNSYLGAEFSAPSEPEVAKLFAESRSSAESIRERLLEKMALGAIYDHVFGGFFRYTVDGSWQLPHFEKMLFDNAYLLEGYATAAIQTGDYLLADTARGVARWMVQHLQLEHGGFASSLNADSEVAGYHVEGGYYVFSHTDLLDAANQSRSDEQLLQLRGGASVPEAAEFAEELAGAKTVSLNKRPSERELAGWRAIMAEAAKERLADPTFLAPERDNKIVAAWNGQAIIALLQTHTIWPEEGLAAAALRAGQYLWQNHVRDAKVGRTSFDGTLSEVEGTLGDYSQMMRAFLALYRFDGSQLWWDRAQRVNELMHQRLVTDEVIREVSSEDTQVENLGALVDGDYWATPLDDTEPSGSSRYVLAQWEMNVLQGQSQEETEHMTRLVSFGVTSGAEAASHLGGMLEAAVRLLMPPRTLLVRGHINADLVRIRQWATEHNYLPIVISSFGGGAPVSQQAAAIEADQLLLRCTGSICLAPLHQVAELPT